MIFRSSGTTLSTANSGQQQIKYCYERTPDLSTPWIPTPFTLPNPPARGHREQAQVSRALILQHGDGRRWPSAGMMQCSAPQCAMRWCSDGSNPTSNFQGSQSVFCAARQHSARVTSCQPSLYYLRPHCHCRAPPRQLLFPL